MHAPASRTPSAPPPFGRTDEVPCRGTGYSRCHLDVTYGIIEVINRKICSGGTVGQIILPGRLRAILEVCYAEETIDGNSDSPAGRSCHAWSVAAAKIHPAGPCAPHYS